MSKNKSCQLCGTEFVCGSPFVCWCTTVKVDPLRRKQITGLCDDCVCPSCLSMK